MGDGEMLHSTVEILYLDRRTVRILKENGIKTMDQLLSHNIASLSELPGMTIEAVQDVRECMMCYCCQKSYYQERTCHYSYIHGNRYVCDCNSRSCDNQVLIDEMKHFFET